MNQLPGSSTLRLALDAIANRHAGPTVRLQISEVEQRRPRFKHSIELVEAVDDASAGRGQFTCFMHALELVPPTVRVAAIMQRFDVIPGSAFIKQLIQLEWLVPTGQPKDGDILVYFDGTTPKHAGKCWHGIVESKWGLGHLWRHPQCEVPLSYGDDTGAFERVDGLTASEWFVKYAESRVGPDAIAALAPPDA